MWSRQRSAAPLGVLVHQRRNRQHFALFDSFTTNVSLHMLAAAPLFDERLSIVSGSKAVGTFDVPDDGEPGESYKSAG